MKNLEKYFDHTLLKNSASKDDYIKLADEAKKYNFFSVCVPPVRIQLMKELLKNTEVKVCTVVGFPFGYQTTATKIFEVENAIENGADEIDVVIQVGLVKDREFDLIKDELIRIKKAAGNHIVKAIIETADLTANEIKIVSKLVEESGVDFVKTSTGFSSRGASLEDIEIIKSSIEGNAKIKASGGIKTYEDAIKFIEKGADRLGLSKSVDVIQMK